MSSLHGITIEHCRSMNAGPTLHDFPSMAQTPQPSWWGGMAREYYCRYKTRLLISVMAGKNNQSCLFQVCYAPNISASWFLRGLSDIQKMFFTEVCLPQIGAAHPGSWTSLTRGVSPYRAEIPASIHHPSAFLSPQAYWGCSSNQARWLTSSRIANWQM